MSKVLITGIEGFTGRYLATELRQAGYAVVGTSFGNGARGGTAQYACDLRDLDSVRAVLDDARPDVVVHLAAIAFVAHGDVNAMYSTNLLGTRNLLEALTQCAVQPSKVLIASSANVYGNVSADCLHETTMPSPANDYAVSKLAMEYASRLWADRLPIVLVRPFNYTGVGQSAQFLVPKIVEHFRKRSPVLELGNLDVVRDFSDVRDVVIAYRLLVEHAMPPEAYGQSFNICSGRGTALARIIEIMEHISGHTPEIRVNPAFVRTNEVKILVGSREKLEGLVGSMPLRTIEETLSWMYAA